MNAIGVRWDLGPVVAVPQDVRWDEDTKATARTRR